MIDYLKILFETENYEEILRRTKTSKDPAAMFIRLATLIMIREYNIALSYIIENQMELYMYDAPQLIKQHIDILIDMDELDQALNMLKQYEDFPYFSLETNEVVASLGEKVQKLRKERLQQHQLDLREIERRLYTDNYDLIFSAVLYMQNNYHESYNVIIEKALLNHHDESLKSYLLLVLKQVNYDKEVQINKFGKLRKVTPAKLFIPEESPTQKALYSEVEKIIATDDDVNFGEVIHRIRSAHFLFIYPQNIERSDIRGLSQLLHYVALKFAGRSPSIEDFVLNYNADLEVLKQLYYKYHFSYIVE